MKLKTDEPGEPNSQAIQRKTPPLLLVHSVRSGVARALLERSPGEKSTPDEEFIIVRVHDREEDDLRHSLPDTFAERSAIENKYNSDIICLSIQGRREASVEVLTVAANSDWAELKDKPIPGLPSAEVNMTDRKSVV